MRASRPFFILCHPAGGCERSRLPASLRCSSAELCQLGKLVHDLLGTHRVEQNLQQTVAAHRGDLHDAALPKGFVADPVPCLQGAGGAGWGVRAVGGGLLTQPTDADGVVGVGLFDRIGPLSSAALALRTVLSSTSQQEAGISVTKRGDAIAAPSVQRSCAARRW